MRSVITLFLCLQSTSDIRPVLVTRPIFNSRANNKNRDFPYNVFGYEVTEFCYKGNVGYQAKICEILVCGLISSVCTKDLSKRWGSSMHFSSVQLLLCLFSPGWLSQRVTALRQSTKCCGPPRADSTYYTVDSTQPSMLSPVLERR